MVALTFSPHPTQVLAPSRAPQLMCTAQRRRELLAEAGVDAVVEQPFTMEFSRLSPREFVQDILVGGLKARWVIVGTDFSFGRDRAGSTRVLAELLAEHGAEAVIVPTITVPDPDGGSPTVCSSTQVRKAVREGRPDRAALVLGRPPEVEGVVVPGKGRGRTISVPTANLRPAAELLPAVGVYAAWGELLGEAEHLEPGFPPSAGSAAVAHNAVVRPVTARYPAAVNVGYNPTFAADRRASAAQDPAVSSVPPVTIEAHLILPDGAPPLPDLYGRELRLMFVERLRDERRFPSVDALVSQIRDDIATAKERLAREA